MARRCPTRTQSETDIPMADTAISVVCFLTESLCQPFGLCPGNGCKVNECVFRHVWSGVCDHGKASFMYFGDRDCHDTCRLMSLGSKSCPSRFGGDLISIVNRQPALILGGRRECLRRSLAALNPRRVNLAKK